MGMETRAFDRLYYRWSGAGAKKLPNGERVTRLYAPPTAAISTEAVLDYQLLNDQENGAQVLGDFVLPALIKASGSLYKARGNNKRGLILPFHKDELTINSGELASKTKNGSSRNLPDEPNLPGRIILNHSPST